MFAKKKKDVCKKKKTSRRKKKKKNQVSKFAKYYLLGLKFCNPKKNKRNLKQNNKVLN